MRGALASHCTIAESDVTSRHHLEFGHDRPQKRPHLRGFGRRYRCRQPLVDLIKPLVRATARPGADAEIGGFGGLFDLKARGLQGPGAGRRHRRRRHQGQDRDRDRPARHIGIDLVAMSVNDLVVQGAEPLFFLDYFACGKLDPEAAPRSSPASPKAAGNPAAR
jgi:hypothetical protein